MESPGSAGGDEPEPKVFLPEKTLKMALREVISNNFSPDNISMVHDGNKTWFTINIESGKVSMVFPNVFSNLVDRTCGTDC
jgi:hypothetical protein